MKKPIEKDAMGYGRDIIGAVVKYMTVGPIVAMVWEGNSSVAVVKKLVGPTDPDKSPVGTIRGDYTLDSYYACDFDNSRAIRNLIHCTDNPVEYAHESSVWFNEKELLSYRLVQDEILYDVNLDGILE
jgi:nucleoside-diphosphate kinase